MDDEDLPYDGSELGTKAHWDAAYERELQNFDDTDGQEVGEIWFGDDVLERTRDFAIDVLRAHAPALQPPPPALQDLRILDVGCGNGTTAVALAEEGFRNIVGSDYSQASVDLAIKVTNRAGVQGVSYVVDDVLATSFERRSFDAVVDKGTLDAIGLHPDHGALHRRVYRDTMARILRPGGFLIITSCNSTREELCEEFTAPRPAPAVAAQPPLPPQPPSAAGAEAPTPDEPEPPEEPAVAAGVENEPETAAAVVFRVLDFVRDYPTFEFGGVTGCRVATVAFEVVLLEPLAERASSSGAAEQATDDEDAARTQRFLESATRASAKYTAATTVDKVRLAEVRSRAAAEGFDMLRAMEDHQAEVLRPEATKEDKEGPASSTNTSTSAPP